jgi:hypothetical protein
VSMAVPEESPSCQADCEVALGMGFEACLADLGARLETLGACKAEYLAAEVSAAGSWGHWTA